MSDESEAYTPDEGEAPQPEAPKKETPDKTFIDSAGHSLNGIELYAYSPERMWAADAIGLRYGWLSKEAIEQFVANGTYPGMAGDIPILMYVCSLKTRDEVAWVRRNPVLAEQRAADFAKKHKLVTPKQGRWWEAYQIFMQMMREINTAYGEPAGVETGEKKTTMA